MLKFFAEKNVSSFCSAKATHIFSAKNIRILYIESAKTVNEMTLNELVKLTMLWITGPCLCIIAVCSDVSLYIQLDFVKTWLCEQTSWTGPSLHINEPAHDKTYKMACVPSEDSDQPHRAFPQVLTYPFSAQQTLWLDWVDAQADAILLVFVMCWLILLPMFVFVVLHLFFYFFRKPSDSCNNSLY